MRREEEGGGGSSGSRARCIQEQLTVRELQVEEEGEVENQVMLKEGAIEVSLASGQRLTSSQEESSTVPPLAKVLEGSAAAITFTPSLSLYLSISQTQLG